ncbi:MAG: hypothetical protein ACI81L_000507 [Verrucomicrobiales bacterium]|jgi:hypothetical protein
MAVAWTGVCLVNDELIRPAPATQQEAAVLSSTATRTVSPTLSTSSTSTTGPVSPTTSAVVASSNGSEDAEGGGISTSTVSPETATTLTSALARTASPRTSSSSTSQAPATTNPAKTTTTAPSTSQAPATTNPAKTTTTTPPPTTTTKAPAQVLTFNLVGGSTAISFSSSATTVLWANPKDGFEVRVEQGPNAEVEFRADDHRSRIEAWWAGQPAHQIREDADN